MKIAILFIFFLCSCIHLDEEPQSEKPVDPKSAKAVYWNQLKEMFDSCKPNDGIAKLNLPPRADYECQNGARFKLISPKPRDNKRTARK